MAIQSRIYKRSTLNISPPKRMITIWPTMISKAIGRNPSAVPVRLEKADLLVRKALALNMFQNWSMTKKVKNKDCS